MALGARSSRSTADDVAHHILSGIKDGVYSPGDRLPTEPEIARQLGVGRTSVREGVGQLRMLGVVEVRQGVGTFVRDENGAEAQLAFHQWTAVNQYEILDIFEVRMSLEATAAALAAQRATRKDLDLLSGGAQAHLRAHRQHDSDALVETDRAFHDALIKTSGNEALHRVYSGLVPELVDYRRKSLVLEGASERSSHNHLPIVTAIEQHDPLEARKATLGHLSSLCREVINASRRTVGDERTIVPILRSKCNTSSRALRVLEFRDAAQLQSGRRREVRMRYYQLAKSAQGSIG